MHEVIIDETLAVCTEHRAPSRSDTFISELYVSLLIFFNAICQAYRRKLHLHGKNFQPAGQDYFAHCS